MNVRRTSAVAFALLAAATASALAADDATGRYTMSPVDGGFLRLDTQTGSVAMCARADATWSCKPVEDQTPAASGGEIARLEDENRALKEKVKALEESLESGKPAPPDAASPGAKLQLPTDEEVDQALDYIERIYKKFRDRVKDLDKPLPPPSGTEPPKGSL